MSFAKDIEWKFREGEILLWTLKFFLLDVIPEELYQFFWLKASQAFLLAEDKVLSCLQWQIVEGIESDHAFSIRRKL